VSETLHTGICGIKGGCHCLIELLVPLSSEARELILIAVAGGKAGGKWLRTPAELTVSVQLHTFYGVLASSQNPLISNSLLHCVLFFYH